MELLEHMRARALRLYAMALEANRADPALAHDLVALAIGLEEWAARLEQRLVEPELDTA
jgi:hypothetical protein